VAGLTAVSSKRSPPTRIAKLAEFFAAVARSESISGALQNAITRWAGPIRRLRPSLRGFRRQAGESRAAGQAAGFSSSASTDSLTGLARCCKPHRPIQSSASSRAARAFRSTPELQQIARMRERQPERLMTADWARRATKSSRST